MQTTFRLFDVSGIPVSVNLWYVVLVAWMVSSGDVAGGLVWAFALTGSLLVHEFGHASVAASYRLNPHILLHGFGGLCFHERAQTDGQDARIIAAGPAAGLALGIVSVGVTIGFELLAPGVLDSKPLAGQLLFDLIWINIVWSLLNLLPLFPLDGGQLFRLGMLRVMSSPATAERVTHVVGLVLAVAAAGVALFFSMPFAVLISGLLAADNIRGLSNQGASGPIRSQHRHARALLDEAEDALEAGQPAEAARLGHQVRALPSLPDDLADHALELVALGTLLAGRQDEGLRFAGYAPMTPRLAEACVEAYLARGQREEAKALAASPVGAKLPAALKTRL